MPDEIDNLIFPWPGSFSWPYFGLKMKLLTDSSAMLFSRPKPRTGLAVYLMVIYLAFPGIAGSWLHAAEPEPESEAKAAAALERRTAVANRIEANQSILPAWQNASESIHALEDFLEAVPLVKDPALRQDAYPLVKSLLDGLPEVLAEKAVVESSEAGATSAVTRAAIRAMGSIPGHDAETFAALATLAESGKEPGTAIAVLRHLPRDSWDKSRAASLAQAVATYGASRPEADRGSSSFKEAVQFGLELAGMLPEAEAQAIRERLEPLLIQAIVIRSVPYKMKFDIESFTVTAGKPVEILFENVDILPHNLLIAAPGSLNTVGTAAEKMATTADAYAKHFIPDIPEVLHATKMLNARQRERLRFTAPITPGNYPYICTFPGHWRMMNGIMTVK